MRNGSWATKNAQLPLMDHAKAVTKLEIYIAMCDRAATDWELVDQLSI